LEHVTLIINPPIRYSPHLQVMEDENGVLLIGSLMNEHGLEIGAAGRQDDFVCLQKLSFHGERDVDKVFPLEQVLKDRDQVGAVIVPFEEEVLTLRSHHL